MVTLDDIRTELEKKLQIDHLLRQHGFFQVRRNAVQKMPQAGDGNKRENHADIHVEVLMPVVNVNGGAQQRRRNDAPVEYRYQIPSPSFPPVSAADPHGNPVPAPARIALLDRLLSPDMISARLFSRPILPLSPAAVKPAPAAVHAGGAARAFP